MKDSLAILMKTNLEEMSVSPSLAMLMKRNGLFSASRDIDEKKASYWQGTSCTPQHFAPVWVEDLRHHRQTRRSFGRLV